MKADLYNLKNEKVGTAELPANVFNVPWNPVAVKQVLLAQLANKRRPWAHAKFRGEVRGGGKKPWRQKGTGRARHGSTRSPLWIGGGKSHGPRSDRDYSQKANKKVRRLALFSVLSKKFAEGDLRVFDALTISEPKTRAVYGDLRALVGASKRSKKLDVLLIPPAGEKNLVRAARNLVKTKVENPGSLNVYDVLNYKHVFIDQKAVGEVAAHYPRN